MKGERDEAVQLNQRKVHIAPGTSYQNQLESVMATAWQGDNSTSSNKDIHLES